MRNKAIFLDRDGVINRAIVRDGIPFPPQSVEEFDILPEVADACGLLKSAGFMLIVATNQPDVGRGTMPRETVEAIHAEMCRRLPIDRVEVCFDPGGQGLASEFRKPRPGMLLQAARELDLNLGASFMVGDRWRDIDCGRAAGCTTIFIDRGYTEPLRSTPHYRARDLMEAAKTILSRDRRGAVSLQDTRTMTNSVASLKDLRIKIFADGADRAGMLRLAANPLIQGLTTNPTLMKKAGIADYEAFARDILSVIRDKPISFEVFSDDFDEMRRQALKIASWQENVYVKIPVTNTEGISAVPLISQLAREGVKMNVTAILTPAQVREVAAALDPDVPAVVSVFAGRIADTGVDPQPIIAESLRILKDRPLAELLWASVREALNIFQADSSGCHIVTVPNDILCKAIDMCGMDLELLSRETVRMFARDAASAGFAV